MNCAADCKPQSNDVVVVGAGLAGLVTALSFSRRGRTVWVYEKRDEATLLGGELGRSINLTLSERGLRALARLEVGGDLRSLGVAASARCVHHPDGTRRSTPYGLDDEAIYSISRKELVAELYAQARREPNLRLRLGVAVVPRIVDGVLVGPLPPASGRAPLFAADGVNSPTRRALEEERLVTVSHTRFAYGYKELILTPDVSERLELSPAAIHLWPRDGWFLMAFPNRDGSFRAIAFLPGQGSWSLAAIAHPAGAAALLGRCLQGRGQGIDELLPALGEQLAARPQGWLSEVRCRPWSYAGQLALLGDAAHGMLPFYGQGINSTFEDCEALHRCLQVAGSDLGQALAQFEAARLPNADAIAELSRGHFFELRDGPRAPDFPARRRLEARLLELFPARFHSIYHLIAFTDVPYSEIRLRAERQAWAVRTLLSAGWGDPLSLASPDFREAAERALDGAAARSTPSAETGAPLATAS